MSGGGNGGGGYSGAESVDCSSLRITTSLASPDPMVISTLSVGDILTIELASSTGPAKVMTDNNQIAGAVTPPDLATLIQCISDGHTYCAEVISISGGNCRVQIYHA